ncbi:hypothetical protein A8F94_10440 [Bacillus sp. FJAT-27225]|uniref:alpha/beta hydrolase n=1 Tax=Bacillus sp. FJAT-27225 TaxID=1743144 RepID=UPI00080C2150|nr:alpha/beta hydrolase [Bacillus sp. FJAT-27225]OCA88214.1 hypothetical protein A8F94_10440 [Bacillus sp. FJAT-27225]
MKRVKKGIKFIGFGLIIIILLLLGLREVNQFIIKKNAGKLASDGGVSELVELDVNGTKQYLLIEGKDTSKPVLLFLHGGPGQPFPFGVSARGKYPELTEDYVAVYYDQRGSGKSYFKDIPMETMNINQFLDDTDVVVDYLRTRFEAEKIMIAGISWGSIIGTKYSSLHPEKVGAYIGISQFVDLQETQRRSTEFLKGIAQQEKDEQMLNDLESLGEPPYTGNADEIWSKYLSRYGGDNYEDENVKKASIFGLIKSAFISPDYSLSDIYKSMASGATFSLLEAKNLQAEINQVNLIKDVPRFEVPVYLIQGKHDGLTNYELTKEYFDNLEAPKGKGFTTLEQSAHYPNEEDFNILVAKLKEISAAQ